MDNENKKEAASKENNKSPFEMIMESFLTGGFSQQNDFPVEHFSVLFDCFVHYFYGKEGDNKSGIETLTDFDGLKTEFDVDANYPYLKKDRSGKNFKIVVLPDKKESEERKEILVQQAIKEFDCLENLQVYNLLLKMIQHYDEKLLIDFIQKHDPMPNRDKTEVIKYLNNRALLKENNTKSI